MTLAGILLTVLSVLAVLAGWILFMREAFRSHVLWGLACLFFPAVQIVFLFMNLATTWRWFALQVMGYMLFIVGVLLVVSGVAGREEVSTAEAFKIGIQSAFSNEKPDSDSGPVPADRVAVVLSPSCPGPCTALLKMSNVPANETVHLIPGERRTFGLPVESTLTPANTNAHCQWPPLTFTPAHAGQTFTLECPAGK